MVVKDMDADGDLDIVTSNDTDLSVTVLRNRGARQFQLDPGYYIGAGVRGVDAGDLDEDGNMDVVVGCHELDQLAILWGQPDGSLGQLEFLAVPQNPFFTSIRDLDADGHLDVAFITDFQDSVQVLWGDGSRGLGLQRSGFSVAVRPRVLAIEDVSSDGVLDIVATSCVDSTVLLLLGQGARMFAIPSQALQLPGLRPCDVAVGDLDGDGLADIGAIGNDFGSLYDHVPLALGTGIGTFILADAPVAGPGPGAIEIGRVNLDALPDIAVANDISDEIELFSGRGDGTTGPSTRLPVGDCPSDVKIVDFDDDGTLDIVSLDTCSSTVTITWGQSSFLTGQLVFSPDLHQIGTQGYSIRGEINLGADVSPPVDPNDVHLYWGATRLGRATGAGVADSLTGKVVTTFDVALVNGLPLGVQELTIIGCDRLGAGFTATARVTLLSGRRSEIWQGSAPGRLPIAIMMPRAIGEAVELRIYDSRGRLVRTIGEPRLSGPIVWDGSSETGVKAPSGIYFARAVAAGLIGEGRIILVR